MFRRLYKSPVNQWFYLYCVLGCLLAASSASAIDVGQGDLPIHVTTGGVTYDVTEDITATAGWWIDHVDDVTINGHGYQITSTGGSGFDGDFFVYFDYSDDCYIDSLDVIATGGNRTAKFDRANRCVMHALDVIGQGFEMLNASYDDTVRYCSFVNTIPNKPPQCQLGGGALTSVGLTMHDCYINWNDTVDTISDQVVGFFNATDGFFRDNVVVLNDATGHEIFQVWEAQRITATGNQFRSYDGRGTVSIRSGSTDLVFTDNFIYNAGSRALAHQIGCDRGLLQGNTIFSEGSEALYLSSGNVDSEFKNNLIIGDGAGSVIRMAGNGPTNAQFYNNTIINHAPGSAGQVVGIENSDDTHTAIFKNNLLVTRASKLIDCVAAGWDGLTADYNHYYQVAAGEFFVTYQGISYPDLASWAQEANGSSGDPTFTSEVWDSTGVWTVAATPPIDGGLNSVIDWALDLAGNQRIEPATNLVDQGAYEDQAGGDPTGACCNDDGTCTITTAANCVAGDETWSGAATVCFPNTCTQPAPATGACCFTDGSCVVQSEASCIAANGLYEIDDAVCDPNPCPSPASGACCVDVNCSVISETACTQAGGAYEGDATVCDPNPCVGACCIGEYLRVWPEGRYTGTSEPEIDLLRAECFVMTEAACTVLAGTYQGDGTDCDPNPCPQPSTGACCVSEPPVTVCYVYTTGECEGNAGIYQGNDTACLPDPCNPASTGACCYGRGTDCAVVTIGECEGVLGGTYQGIDIPCLPFPCGGPSDGEYPIAGGGSTWSGYRHLQTTGYTVGLMSDMHFGQASATAMANTDAILGWVLEHSPIGVVFSGDLTESGDSLGLTVWLADDSVNWDDSSVILPVPGNHDTVYPINEGAPTGTDVYQPIVSAWPERFQGNFFYRWDPPGVAFSLLVTANNVDTLNGEVNGYRNCNPPGTSGVINPDYTGFDTPGSNLATWLETESADFDGWLIGSAHRPSWSPFTTAATRPPLLSPRSTTLKTMTENGLSLWASGDQHMVVLSKPYYQASIPSDSVGTYQLVLAGGYANRSVDRVTTPLPEMYFSEGVADAAGGAFFAYGAVLEVFGDIGKITIARADQGDTDPATITEIYTGRLRRNPGR